MSQLQPDVEVKFVFNKSLKGKVTNGFRPAHLVRDDYLTIGLHTYYSTDNLDELYGTITFITPEVYPNTMWFGKMIEMYVGKNCIGYAIVTNVYNPILLGRKPKDYNMNLEEFERNFDDKQLPEFFNRKIDRKGNPNWCLKVVNDLKEYIQMVEQVCEKLLNYLNIVENLNIRNKYELLNYIYKNNIFEIQTDEYVYNFHGQGCTAVSDTVSIKWDFGYRGRWCGIELYKFIDYCELVKREIYKIEGLTKCCEQLIEKEILLKKENMYYIRIQKNETFQPEFPQNYDEIHICYYEKVMKLPKNKITDRFIRKSRNVSKQLKEDCILKFIQNGKEIFSIPYDDTGYPDSAVCIMNDKIIQNLLKGENVNG